MKYPNSQKGLFRASVYYRGDEQQQSIGTHLLFLLSFLQRLATKKMVKVRKLRNQKIYFPLKILFTF